MTTVEGCLPQSSRRPPEATYAASMFALPLPYWTRSVRMAPLLLSGVPHTFQIMALYFASVVNGSGRMLP